MDFHLDNHIKLCTDSEFQSLYKWCIREFDENGEQVGRDQIPWSWSLDFSVKKFSYFFDVDNSEVSKFFEFRNSDDSEEVLNEITEVISSERIVASLIPSRDEHCITTFSMFGTNRNIEDLKLIIRKSDQASSHVWGCVSYTTEIDFRDVETVDCIQIFISLTQTDFERISELVKFNGVTEAHFRVSGVSGFYSEWSPGISTSNVKVLTRSDDQNLEIPDDCKIKPYRLGKLNEFILQIGKDRDLIISNADNDEDWLFEDTKNDEASGASYPIDKNVFKQNFEQLNNTLNALKRPLWVIVAILILILLRS